MGWRALSRRRRRGRLQLVPLPRSAQHPACIERSTDMFGSRNPKPDFVGSGTVFKWACMYLASAARRLAARSLLTEANIL